MSVIMQNEIFLTLRDRVALLVNATILLPVSVFIVSITIRNISQVSGIINVYILGVRCTSAVVSIVTAILCSFVALASPRRSFSLVTMLFGILAAFGALFSLATIFFNAQWAGHWEALQRMVFLLTGILNLICTVVITILLARRFQNTALYEENFSAQGCLSRSSTILAALVIISGLTGLSGFTMGVVVNWRLIRESQMLGGGLHSGFLACMAGVLFLSALYGCKRYPEITLASSLVLSILSLVGAAISYYTEELEFQLEIKYVEEKKPIFVEIPEFKFLLLAKSSITIFASVFTIVFGTPLTSCMCCLLRGDVLNDTASPPIDGEATIWLPPKLSPQQQCFTAALQQLQQHQQNSYRASPATAASCSYSPPPPHMNGHGHVIECGNDMMAQSQSPRNNHLTQVTYYDGRGELHHTMTSHPRSLDGVVM